MIAKVEGAPRPAAPASEEAGSPAAKLRELLEHVCSALGAPCRIDVSEDDETINATLTGPELGLVIGKRGHTIDAIQYLANAILWRGAEERAQGGRGRRRRLPGAAPRRARGHRRPGRSGRGRSQRQVALEPMTAVERKIVHLHLAEREDVVTSSDGTEPNRHVVVAPAPPE